MGMDLASFHSFDEGMAVMEVLWESQTADNIWLGLIRNINGMKYNILSGRQLNETQTERCAA